jgi:hypothetical protein
MESFVITVRKTHRHRTQQLIQPSPVEFDRFEVRETVVFRATRSLFDIVCLRQYRMLWSAVGWQQKFLQDIEKGG